LWCSGEEILVEIVGPIDRSDDPGNLDGLQAGVGLLEKVESNPQLVEGKQGFGL
jgi:hypothetical protein